jgi:hypothetical protein
MSSPDPASPVVRSAFCADDLRTRILTEIDQLA